MKSLSLDSKRMLSKYSPSTQQEIVLSFGFEMGVMAFWFPLGLIIKRWNTHRRAEERRIGKLMLKPLQLELRSVFWEAIQEVKGRTPLEKITGILLADSCLDTVVLVPPLGWEHKGFVFDSVKDQLDLMLSHLETDDYWAVRGGTLDDDLVVLFEHANIVAKELSESLLPKSCSKHFLFGDIPLGAHNCDDLLVFENGRSKEKVLQEGPECIGRCVDERWREHHEVHLSDIDYDREVHLHIEVMTRGWGHGWRRYPI
jgi:hypothetical protein